MAMYARCAGVHPLASPCPVSFVAHGERMVEEVVVVGEQVGVKMKTENDI